MSNVSFTFQPIIHSSIFQRQSSVKENTFQTQHAACASVFIGFTFKTSAPGLQGLSAPVSPPIPPLLPQTYTSIPRTVAMSQPLRLLWWLHSLTVRLSLTVFTPRLLHQSALKPQSRCQARYPQTRGDEG